MSSGSITVGVERGRYVSGGGGRGEGRIRMLVGRRWGSSGVIVKVRMEEEGNVLMKEEERQHVSGIHGGVKT